VLTALSASCAKREPADPATAQAAASPSESGTSESSAAEPAFYTVGHYDGARNPADDLAMTVERAKAEGKHVLVQVGGDWCGWCKRMSQFIESNAGVRQQVERDFLVMKVTYDQNQKNEPFLSGFPKIKAYPHLFVIDGEGHLLHSQDTEELEQDRSYNETAYLAFLEKWKPAAASNPSAAN
jgi:thiol:disulfide interchange protein